MLITTKEVASLLRVHPKHVYRLLRRGLPAHRVGDEWRFEPEEVMDWARRARSAPLGDGGAAASSPTSAPPLIAGNGDVVLEMLLEELRDRASVLLGHVQADHATGLQLLARSAVLAAGCHAETAPSSAPTGKLARIHLAERELGLAFRAGMRVRRASVVIGRRFATRPETAGIRARFDRVLEAEGVAPERAHAGATAYASHRDAVMAVVRGEAEVALASRAWALRAGLGFFAVAREDYGIVVRAPDLGHPAVVTLCEVAQSGAFRKRIRDQAGYGAARAGQVRFEGPGG